jgi:7-dehydrocholesterol reductase
MNAIKPLLTWCMSLGMPIAIMCWAFYWSGGMSAVPTVAQTAAYAFFWAVQLLSWKLNIQPLVSFLGLCCCLSLVRMAYPGTLLAFWPGFLTLSSACGLAWSMYFYWTASRPGKGIMDWYSGIDLHPVVWGIDIKLFIASRIGMASWGLAVFHTLTDWSLGTGSVPLSVWLTSMQQLYYIVRFFTWESQYLHTMDQQHDRAGFYICWGCLAYIPALYWLSSVVASPVLFAEETHGLGAGASLACFVVGVASITILDAIDRAKTRVRADKHCTVWGKKATYITTQSGSILLTCGGWGAARHLHYVFELLAAFTWTAPVAGSNLLGYMYCVYLTILLVNRLYRDDTRCRQKYGADWEEYCRQVPYKMIPGVF